ncbi:MAG: hypothetical protein ACX931_16970 [Saccharospirillum sp.]|jgi:hypothetical protein
MTTLHHLAKVPDHIVDNPAHVRGQQRWARRYNVAGWFRFDQLDNSLIRLILRYRDATGSHQVVIDQGRIGHKTILLSGIADVKLAGTINAMELLLECHQATCTVDELFVQPVKDNAQASPKRNAHKVFRLNAH